MEKIDLVTQRMHRTLAYTQLGQIVLLAMKNSLADDKSELSMKFNDIANHIQEHFGSNRLIDHPYYKVVSFVDGLALVSIISEIELYFQDLATIILIRNPEKIGKDTIELKDQGFQGAVFLR